MHLKEETALFSLSSAVCTQPPLLPKDSKQGLLLTAPRSISSHSHPQGSFREMLCDTALPAPGWGWIWSVTSCHHQAAGSREEEEGGKGKQVLRGKNKPIWCKWSSRAPLCRGDAMLSIQQAAGQDGSSKMPPLSQVSRAAEWGLAITPHCPHVPIPILVSLSPPRMAPPVQHSPPGSARPEGGLEIEGCCNKHHCRLAELGIIVAKPLRTC